ncbi:MAG: formylglycine-generating enzyme family protein [Magnetococcus sp. DMHC-1]|nr:formylglycine-generating enzyme family protein [Magnetococcales bacterium]
MYPFLLLMMIFMLGPGSISAAPAQAKNILEKKKNYTNSIGMEFVLIQPGSLSMGPFYSSNICNSEVPLHEEVIHEPFYLSKYEVTQDHWEAVMENNPSRTKGGSLPVERITWSNVQEFINKLNEAEKTNLYRLPTEAEWEYAALAGEKTNNFLQNSDGEIGQYAWFKGSKTYAVGQLKPNAWGLYDMFGNVWELVNGNFREFGSGGPQNSASSPESNPAQGSKIIHLGRGGGWIIDPNCGNISDRHFFGADDSHALLGFRLLMEIK